MNNYRIMKLPISVSNLSFENNKAHYLKQEAFSKKEV